MTAEEKFARFEQELEALCAKYYVSLEGYEGECNAVIVTPQEAGVSNLTLAHWSCAAADLEAWGKL